RIPPHDNEAEEAVLGALLIDRDAVTRVSELLRPEYFYQDANGFVYGAMLALYESNKPIDILTLTNQLKKKKQFEKCGGTTFLTSLANAVPTAANVEHYATIVKEKFVRRYLIKTSGSITELAFSEDRETNEVLDHVEQHVFQISQESVRTGFIHIK